MKLKQVELRLLISTSAYLAPTCACIGMIEPIRSRELAPMSVINFWD